MISKKKKIEALIRNSLSDANLSEEARERMDEIHRSAICTAHKIAGHYDQWSVAYEAALYKELQKRQGQIQRLRERGAGWPVDAIIP
jgi:phage-related minor tail protein